VDGALFGVFINQGEVCSAGSRVLVEKKIYGKFVEAMTEKAKRIKLGPKQLRAASETDPNLIDSKRLG
jgi:betaine-aldehyde dehydrogenase